MKHSTRHPSDDLLREYALGRLDDSESVETHVTDCQQCARQVDTIAREAGDTFVNELRRNVPEDENHRSVIDVLSDTIGEVKRISLPDADGHEAPVVTVGSGGAKKQDQLGKFRIVGEIARGGVGAVLRARDEDIGRDVALKVLLDDHANNLQITERFVEEAQIGGQLQHPGIVPIHEMGLLGGKKPYIAMKLVKGQTLSRILDSRHDLVSQRQHFLGVFQQICQPMAYAHSKGVVHRDLKPSNVMVGAFGEVQVMDWGLSKVLARGGMNDDQRATRPTAHSQIETIRSGSGSESLSGSVIGTPAYMAPEQAQGLIEDTDERSDVFGLGAILCEILTGSPPYQGETIGEIFRQARKGFLDDALQRLESCDADEAVVDLATRCLAFEPRQRPRDAGAVLQEMTEYLESLEAKARHSEVEAARSASKAEAERRSRRLTTFLATSLILFLTLGGGGYLWWEGERRERLAAAREDAQASIAQVEALLDQWDKFRNAPTLDVAQARLESTEDALTTALRGEYSEKLEEVKQQLDVRQRSQQFLNDLNDIEKATDAGAIDSLFTFAFADLLSLDVFSADAFDLLEAMKATPIEEEIALALDEWALVRKRKGSEWEQLPVLAKSLDSAKAWRILLWEEVEAGQVLAMAERMLRDRERQIPVPTLTSVAQYVRADHPQVAESLLREALRREPNDFRANSHLGSLLGKTAARRDEAVLYQIAAHALRPDHLRNMFGLLSYLIESSDYDRAIDVHTHALLFHRRRPDDPIHDKEAILDWGYAGSFLDEYEIAASKESLDAWIAALKECWSPDHTHPHVYEALGNALGHRYNAEEADQALSWPHGEAHRTRRGNPHVLSMLARVQYHVGRPADAVGSMEEAIALEGGSIRSLLNYRSAFQGPVTFRSIDDQLAEKRIVDVGDDWKYFKGNSLSSPTQEWTGTEFDDQDWLSGPSGFGYGYGDAVEASNLDDMRYAYRSLYVRKRFWAPRTDSIAGISLRLFADDGFVAYINGKLIASDNMDSESGNSMSAKRHVGAALSPWRTIDITSAIEEGENVLAIAAANVSDDDRSFSLIPIVAVQYVPESEEYRAHLEDCRQLIAPLAKARSYSLYVDGRLLQLQERFQEAASNYLQVVELDPSQLAPFLRLYECECQTEGTAQAKAALRNRLEKDQPRGFATMLAKEELVLSTRFDGDFHLESSEVESVDPRVRHTATRWEICEVGGEFGRDCVFDWISDSALRSLTLPRDRLCADTEYRCRATYVFSPGTQLIQAEATLDPQSYAHRFVPFDLEPFFNADVFVDPNDSVNDPIDGDEHGFYALTKADAFFQRDHLGVHVLGGLSDNNAIQLTARPSRNDPAPIDIPAPAEAEFSAIRILLTGGWNESELPMRFVYTDGTHDRVTLRCEDWDDWPEYGTREPADFFSRDLVPLLKSRAGSVNETRYPMSVFEANFEISPDRKLASIVLEPGSMKGFSPRPEFPSRLNIFAITGVGAPQTPDER